MLLQGDVAMNFGLSAIAEAIGKSRQQILKDLKSKNVSTSWDESTGRRRIVVEASEVLRCWEVDMTVAPSKRQQLSKTVVNENGHLEALLKAKDDMIALLVAQLEVKDEQIAASNRLLAAPTAIPKPTQENKHGDAIQAVEAVKIEIEQIDSQKVEPAPRSFWRRLVG
jgi:hypothetical protein